MARYEIYVTYKQGIFDPPGATAERALANLGYEGIDLLSLFYDFGELLRHPI